MNGVLKKHTNVIVILVYFQLVIIAQQLPWFFGINLALIVVLCMNLKELVKILNIKVKKENDFSWLKYFGVLSLIVTLYYTFSFIFGYVAPIIQIFLFLIIYLITGIHYLRENRKFGL